jgi:hypothetical protein
MRTFNRTDWEASLAEWEAGQFSDEWRNVRHLAAMRGMIYPPTGTKWDSWEDDEPSQRAMLIRAIRETPRLIEEIVGQSRSWHEVIAKLTARRDELREDSWRETRREDLERDELTPQESTALIADILTKIRDSTA